MTESTIPIIDISSPSPQVAHQVLDAASTHGFLFIKNDGTIAPKDITTMFHLSQQFFASPQDNKQAYAIHTAEAGGLNRGWVRMAGEALDARTSDPKEAFNIGPPYPSLQPLPAPLTSHSAVITRFQQSCHDLCAKLLSLIGVALEIANGEDFFASRHDRAKGPSGTIFRMLYYPKTTSSSSSDTIRAGAHSDYGSLTLLFRLPGQPGLEIQTPEGWRPVPVFPDSHALDSPPPILVNIGDLLCYWTRGMLKSTVHRVTFHGGEERYSMAYFCHPLDEVRLESVPSRVIRDFGDRGEEELRSQRERLGIADGDESVITAKEHLERRLKVTYGL